MGYRARFSGEVTITPSLTWAEIGRTARQDLRDLRIRFHEDVTDTDTGQVKVITGVAVKPGTTEGAGYDMVAELQSLVDAYGKSHRFTGRIEATGEEGDQWRLLVRDGKAVQVYPRVVWPDDQETAPRAGED